MQEATLIINYLSYCNQNFFQLDKRANEREREVREGSERDCNIDW